VTEHHHFQIMLHQIEQARWENPAEARRRASLREARGEPRAMLTGRLRNLGSGPRRRPWRRASSPCPDASASC
jgi:hypothetical protein